MNFNDSEHNLLNAKPIYKPMKYTWAYDAWHTQQKIHWIAEEVPLSDDVKDWKVRLTDDERSLLTQIFRFFTQSDIEVNNCYMQHYSKIFKPTEISMMLAAFSNIETIHIDAYSKLLDTIGMPEIEYSAFLNYKEMRDKYEYMHSFNVDDKFNIALTLAGFGAFTEGLQLFASFAILLNFQRFSKMKGMCQIVAWSVRDECYSDDTEILTTNGWKLFSALKNDDLVAQFNKDTKEITFIKPKRIVSYDGEREMVSLSYQKKPINFKVTANHRKLIYYNNKAKVIEARDLSLHYREKLPVSGYISGEYTTLTPLEKLFIIMQADGSIPKGENRTGEKCGYRKCSVFLKKERKIERLRAILKEGGIQYNETFVEKRGGFNFYIQCPINISKYFKDWVDLSKVSVQWCDEFLEEILHWDGHKKSNDSYYYSSTEKSNVDIIQAIAALSGWNTNYYVQQDNRKETYKDVHRITFLKGDFEPLAHDRADFKIEKESGRVWCVEVDTGFIVTRRENCVCISGNTLHTNSIIRLFRTFLQENPEIDTPFLKETITQMCKDIIHLEDEFIRLAFEGHKIEGLTAEEVKQYIRYIGNRRLIQLGYDEVFENAKSNPFPWLDEMLNGVEFANFFENRVTEYSKSATHGTWDDAF